jgi:hypothetical protein
VEAEFEAPNSKEGVISKVMLLLFAGQLARVEGVRGLTSGIIPTLLRQIHNK